jgi:beta-glucosidase
MNNVEQRIDKLLSQMTLKEKIGQCNMIEPFFLFEKLNKLTDKPFKNILDERFINKLLNEYHIGFLLFGGITSLGNDSAEIWASFLKKINQYNRNVTRLKIPLFFGVDAVHGVNFIKGSTIFSHNLGVTSTWNLDLAKEYATIVGKELETLGININFSPTVDVARDQRWGRVYESLGEDPFLAAKMSEVLVQGMQATNGIAACAKHYLGYGEASNGMDRTPADLSERSIWETHIPPFHAAINAGVKTIMVSGGDVNGTPMPSSKKILTEVLRNKLGFKGLTLSDWDDVYRLYKHHHIARTKEEAIMKAFNAGLDLNMIVADIESLEIMEHLVNENKISMDRLNDTVRRVLRVKFELGMFEKDEINIEKAIEHSGNLESKALAQKIALESMTLLKNDNYLLPLSKKIKSILVTGVSANSKRHLCGGWTLGWDSAKEEDLDFLTVIEALQIKVPDCKITYVKNLKELTELDFKENHFDLCLSVVGETPHSEWLGDSMDLTIEKDEIDLLKAAKETNLPLVMVSIIGRPVNMVWPQENVSSILWAYLPGSLGASAITDVLFGDYNPSGKLPISFPKDGNQIPVVYNARRYTSGEIFTKYDPIYPFGFGLSYTEFKYSNLHAKAKVHLGEECLISVEVKNAGNFAGDEVVQLFLVDQFASVTRPLRSLKGFKKISLEPNESKIVNFNLTKDDLSLFDENLEWVEEKREIEVQVESLKRIIEIID